MSGKLDIWNDLAKTDPKHTKPFNRAGGFKGTAIKPIWIIHRLTEKFGACGIGWGLNEPSFQVVPCEGEILVFCTVSGWHGEPKNALWGVGGDKVQAKRQSGPFCDDEAFKKAFTDAVNNAFKFIGVGADVHMGLFDDDKYVTAARAEFADNATPSADVQGMVDAVYKIETQPLLQRWWLENQSKVPEGDTNVLEAVNKRLEQIKTMDRSRAA